MNRIGRDLRLLCLEGFELGCICDVVEVRIVACHVRSTLIEDQRHHNGVYHVCAVLQIALQSCTARCTIRSFPTGLFR